MLCNLNLKHTKDHMRYVGAALVKIFKSTIENLHSVYVLTPVLNMMNTKILYLTDIQFSFIQLLKCYSP